MVKKEKKRKLDKISHIKLKNKENEQTKQLLSSKIFKKGIQVKLLIQRLKKWN